MQVEALIAYIKDSLPHFGSFGSPESLSGGLLNYVWRVPAQPHSLIAKYTPPYIASAPEIYMDAARSSFEAEALTWWSQHQSTDDSIRPPHLLHASGERSVILMEDVGPAPDLAEALKHMSFQEANLIGEQIGAFLGKLHFSTFQDESLAKRFQNEGVQNVRVAVQYNQLESLENARIPAAKEIANKIVSLGQKISKPGVCLIMGDLWPPSILLTQEGIRIIDWEFAHFGWPVQDVAHLVAHLWMQAHMANTHDSILAAQNCLFSFLKTYSAAFGEKFGLLESKEFYFVHIGAEILARTIGNFQTGYLFDGLSMADVRMQTAVEFATQCILHPTADSFFGPFFVI